MNDLDRARRVHALLLEALALPEADRMAFLRERCAGDRRLEAQAAELLSDANEAEDYFERLGDDIGRGLEASTRPVTRDDAAPAGRRDAFRLEIGRKLGHFRITGVLGAGGMGTVYRAADPRLGREVALKVLPAEVKADSEVAARFEQEARLLASLSHENVASIYDVHAEGERSVLVLELVDGPGLDERIAGRRIGIREALEIAAQIARALDVAHRTGIVHRDLKPSNVKIEAASGVVKVLDFGIATALPNTGPEAAATQHRDVVSTGAGRVLGTVAYMSPEQARADTVDERTDIWAWGCVTFEMLSGKRPFRGRTVTDTLAAIIEREPDWSRLPDSTPEEVITLLQRCLRKDARRRLRHAGDIRLVLEEILNPTGPSVPSGRALGRAGWRRVMPWAAGIVAVIAGVFIGRGLGDSSSEPVRRLELLVAGEELRTAVGGRAVAISADGSMIAHTADGQLHLRGLDEFEGREIDATVGAESPAFAPDGEWLAFFARGRLRKVSLLGGDPFVLCEAPLPRGADWGPDDRIVFSDGRALFVVESNGGACGQIAAPESASEATRYVWPSWLPDGRVLFQRTGETSGVAVLDPATGAIQEILAAGSDPRYVETGHLVFTRLGTLFAVPFDLVTGRTSGSPRPLLDGMSAESTGAAHMAFSGNGVLAYIPSPETSRELVWVTRDGRETSAGPAAGDYTTPRVSRDGRHIAVVISRGGERQIWIYDTISATLRQFSQGPQGIWPAWTPDGRKVSFSGGGEGPATIWWQDASGGPAVRLSTTGVHQYANTWAANAEVVAWFQPGDNGTRDIWGQRLESEGGAFAIVSTGAHEQGPALSPDARWIAYAGNSSGRNEVYLENCRGCVDVDGDTPPAGRWQISVDGGGEPLWSPRGDEIYYRQGGRLMSVALDFRNGMPQPQSPAELFAGPYVIGQSGNQNYDLAPDGERFLMVKSPDPRMVQRIRVVMNWLNDLADDQPERR